MPLLVLRKSKMDQCVHMCAYAHVYTCELVHIRTRGDEDTGEVDLWG